MLTKKEIEKLREEISNCSNPLILFDDDPDGLCSFLLFFKFIGHGKGMPLKISSEVGPEWTRKVDEHKPDKVFVLDKPLVSQEFLDAVDVPVIWVDHHSPVKRRKVEYFNPRVNDKDTNYPTSYLCYAATQKDLWISMVGCTADWVVHPDIKQVKKEYPDLLGKNIKDPEALLFDSKFGTLAKMCSFLLKGKMPEVKKGVQLMTTIQTPYELLNQETEAAQYIYKRYQEINKEYEDLREAAEKQKSKDPILLYIYSHDKMSLSQDLSNELLYKHPEKIILIGRERNGEVRLSLRARDRILPPMLEKALHNIQGHGGGHEHACGASVKKEDFDRFLEQFREQL